MKKWILTLISLGYLSPTFATQHDTFLVTAQEFNEISRYDHGLETPNFFTRIFPQNLNPNLVLIPRTNSGFMFGLTGYFQREFDNQLDYAILDTPASNALDLLSVNSKIFAVKPDHDAGYGAYAGYIFPFTGRDIKLEISHNDGGASDDIISPLSDQILWTPTTLYDQTISAESASARFSSTVTQGTLTFGQHILAGTRFRLHPFMGVKYSSLTRELDTSYFEAVSIYDQDASFGNAFVNQRSRFQGLGPAAGFDATYFFAPCFGVIGHLTNAILIGNIDSNNRYAEELTTLTPPITHDLPVNTQINSVSTHRAVPNLDGRLGLFYEHGFCGSATKMTVELGYQFNHFFNAIDTYRSAGTFFNATSDETLASIVTPLHIKQVGDLTIEGPYLSIGVTGLACPNDTILDPILLSVPRLEGGFVFGLGASYFRIQNNQHDYAILDPINALTADPSLLQPPSPNSTLHTAEIDSAYGYMANIGYVFKDTPYDVMLSFQGANASDNDKVVAPEGGTIWPILSVPGFFENNNRVLARSAHADINFRYYEADAVIGQTINADGLVWLRLFEGLQYTNINSKFNVRYDDVTNFPFTAGAALVNFPQEVIEQKSYFSGLGPRVGFNMTLPISGFALTSQLAGGFILGSIDSSYKDIIGTITTQAGGTFTFPNTGVQQDSDTQFSPFLDLRVGIGYAMNLWGKWSIDLGYQTTHYFNAATTFRHATNNAAVFVKQVDDVTIEGPYLNLSITGLGTCPSDCIVRQPYNAFVPELMGGFEFAAEYLYLEPHATNLDVGLFDPTPNPALIVLPDSPAFEPSFNATVHNLNPSYSSGTRLHAGYIVPLSGNDISVNYAFYKADAKENLGAPTTGVIWTITNGNFSTNPNPPTPENPVTSFPLYANAVKAEANFSWNTANIEVGKRVKFYKLMTRFFAGAVHAKVSEDSTITYLDGTSFLGEAVAEDQIRQTNSFSGFGPRIGMSTDFNFGGGFSLVGSIATDLLIGKMDSLLIETSSNGFTDTLNPDQSTRLLPAVDGKFGLAYSVPLTNCTQAGLEVGYQINHYFNVKDSLRFTDYFGTFIKQDQDLSFDGFYARLQIHL